MIEDGILKAKATTGDTYISEVKISTTASLIFVGSISNGKIVARTWLGTTVQFGLWGRNVNVLSTLCPHPPR